MSYSCDGSYVIYEETEPRCRKARSCDACGETIPVGHRYTRVAILFDGSWETVCRCRRCQALHVHLRGLCESRAHYDDLWPDERLACGLDYEDEWGDLPDEIARLAFMAADEMQAEEVPRG